VPHARLDFELLDLRAHAAFWTDADQPVGRRRDTTKVLLDVLIHDDAHRDFLPGVLVQKKQNLLECSLDQCYDPMVS